MKHKINYYLNRLFSSSIEELIKLLRKKTTSIMRDFFDQKRDQHYSSFALSWNNDVTSLNCRLYKLPAEIFEGNWGWLEEVSGFYVSHHFDLLGSGWTHVFHGAQCRGLEGYQFPPITNIKISQDANWLKQIINNKNLQESQHIWKLVDQSYTPIDWQLDFKSGYRWQESVWYKNIQFGHLAGVDVKVPWELARMQHLPHLAWAYALSNQQSGFRHTPDVYLREFRNQVLDFIATNPPRWGVNWVCSMDVSIRMVNWLVAYDLFKSFGAEFDKEFEAVFFRSVYEHGQHIVNNLEWSQNERNNHYLSNVIGLLFISNYLPCNSEINAWLAFSIQEIIKEVKRQFNEDGSNFEFSTSYHRLSAEMVSYATALILGLSDEKQQALLSYDHKIINVEPYLLPAPLPLYPIPSMEKVSPFPDWYFTRIERMAEFTMNITKPDGLVPQIGDNDSGRFLKLFPDYQSFSVDQVKEYFQNLTSFDSIASDKTYWFDNGLDHHHLVASINGLIHRSDFDKFVRNNYLQESKVIEVLSRTKPISMQIIQKIQEFANLDNWEKFSELISSNLKSSDITFFSISRGNLLDGLNIYSYPNMGLYIFKSKLLYLSVRCGLNEQSFNTGHMHNDQLSVELMIEGKNVIRDPGTYIYTPIIEKRNLYRSVKSHFAPQIMNKEISDLTLDVFKNNSKYRANSLYIGPKGFIGTHDAYGYPVYRQIFIENNRLTISDISLGEKLSPLSLLPIPYSPGYGFIQNEIDNHNCT